MSKGGSDTIINLLDDEDDAMDSPSPPSPPTLPSPEPKPAPSSTASGFSNTLAMVSAGAFGALKGCRHVVNTVKGTFGGGNNNSNNNLKAPPKRTPPAGMKELERLIELARYEASTDPYRGIRMLHLMSQGELSSSSSSTTSDAHGNRSDTHNKNNNKIITPWDACQWGILSRGLKSTDRTMLYPDGIFWDEDVNNDNHCRDVLDPSDAESLVRHLTEAACPSLLAWTRQKLQEEAKAQKKREQAEKKKKTAARKKRNRHSSFDDGKTIDLTENDTPSPKEASSWSTTTTSAAVAVNAATPTVLLGTRPTITGYRCPCDFNPFCLASCGGVLDELLQERCQMGVQVTLLDKNAKGDEEVMIVDQGNEETCQNRDGNTRPPPAKRLKSESIEGGEKERKTESTTMDSLATIGEQSTMDERKETSGSKSERQDELDGCTDSRRQRTAGPESAENKTSQETGHDVFAFMNSNGAQVEKDSVANTDGKPVEDDRAKSNGSKIDHTVVVTCKPLEPYQYEDTQESSPAAFYAQKDEKNRLGVTNYSQVTKASLDQVRSATDVDMAVIRRHARRMLRDAGRLAPIVGRTSNGNDKGAGDAPPESPVDEYVTALLEWHKALFFANPVEEKKIIENKKVRLSLPPGIENLGATCYLNTQLQCLAQNPVFMDGIFAWRQVDSSHSMNKVMSELQTLLARMLVGKDGKLSTKSFSNALGLEHYEQQDPNEFAGLLFQRMEESFQKCNDGTDEGKGLSTLLERIFQGTTTYETKCLTCDTISRKNEVVTGIMLPIVEPSDLQDGKTNTGKLDDTDTDVDTDNGKSRKRQKMGDFQDKYGKVADTSVQYCLDQYCASIEDLKDENQYDCSFCKCKQDAERSFKLIELPPVLNIQLSRYEFDKAKNAKFKVTKKVLLPTLLSIEQSEISTAAAPSTSTSETKSKTKTYVLCAVMRHHGTSAYSGHYVAEAMDWTTGQWYEFNDEAVRPLPSGPSCSYEPARASVNESTEDDSEDDIDLTSGSQDAYNMYYVDEEYLGRNAVGTVEKRQTMKKARNVDDNNGQSNDVLINVMNDRDSFYGSLEVQCESDHITSERLRCRSLAIREFMFPSSSSLVLPARLDPYVWVDGTTLRKFLACDTSLDDQLKDGAPILSSKKFLCPHGFLDPRGARRGKLLRKPQYKAYIALLEAERKDMAGTDPMIEDTPIAESEVTPTEGLICDHCSSDYCDELSDKLQLVETIKELYNEVLEVLQAASEGPLYYDVEAPPSSKEDRYAYAVWKPNLTRFKRNAEALFNSVANVGEGGVPGLLQGPKALVVLEGIDDLDLSKFPDTKTFYSAMTDGKEDNSEFHAKINTKITCQHNENKDVHLRGNTRFVPWRVWAMIKKVFPDAIERRIERNQGEAGRVKRDLASANCTICRFDKEATDILKSSLEEWAKSVKNSVAAFDLLRPSRTTARENAKENLLVVESGCRLVHAEDISNFRNAVNAFSSLQGNRCTSLAELKSFAENKAFPNPHSAELDFEQQPTERFLQSLRQLTCRQHKRIVKGSILKEDDESPKKHNLSELIVVLTRSEHELYMASLVDLLDILDRTDGARQEDKIGAPEALVRDIRKKTKAYHPIVGAPLEEDHAGDGDILSFPDGGNWKDFSIDLGLCDCGDCKKELAPVLQRKGLNDDSDIENVSIDGDVAIKQKSRGGGSAAVDPICLESDGEGGSTPNMHSLRVFEVDDNASIDKALEHVREAMGLPSTTKGIQGTLDNWLSEPRRSRRKRRANFPVGGCITREDVFQAAMQHNCAALRLRLFEVVQVPVFSTKLFIVLLLDEVPNPIYLEIGFDWGDKSLEDLIGELKQLLIGEKGAAPEVKLEENVLFLYQGTKELDAGGIKEAAIMGSLLHKANLEDPQTAKKGKAKRSRPERGFRGTLLQSSSSATNNEQDSDNSTEVSTPKPAQKATPKVANKIGRTRSNTIEVSEDDDLSDRDKSSKPSVVQRKVKSSAEGERGDDRIDRLVVKLSRRLHGKLDHEKMRDAVSAVIIDGQDEDDDELIVKQARKLYDNAAVDGKRIFELLKKETAGRNEEALKAAVEWAIESRSQGQDEGETRDSALAKYLDLTETTYRHRTEPREPSAFVNSNDCDEISDDDDDDDDDDFLKKDPAFPKNPKTDSADNIKMRVKAGLLTRLRNENEHPGEPAVWEAVNAALDTNPGLTELESLIDCAMVLFKTKEG